MGSYSVECVVLLAKICTTILTLLFDLIGSFWSATSTRLTTSRRCSAQNTPSLISTDAASIVVILLKGNEKCVVWYSKDRLVYNHGRSGAARQGREAARGEGAASYRR